MMIVTRAVGWYRRLRVKAGNLYLGKRRHHDRSSANHWGSGALHYNECIRGDANECISVTNEAAAATVTGSKRDGAGMFHAHVLMYVQNVQIRFRLN